MEHAVFMESEHLRFRPVEDDEEDKKLLHRWINDEKVREYLELRIFPEPLGSRVVWIQQFSGAHLPEKELRDRVAFLFGLKSDPPDKRDKPIGYTYLQHFNWHVREANGGLVIGEHEHWRKGYGREVTERMLKYAFCDLNLNRVSLQVHADHEEAVSLWKSVGFQEEGRLRQAVYLKGGYRDLLWLAILRSEWENRGPARKKKGEVESYEQTVYSLKVQRRTA